MRHASKCCPYTEGTKPFRGGCVVDSISIENLTKLLKTPIRAIIIDVRRDDAYAAASGVIPGAVPAQQPLGHPTSSSPAPLSSTAAMAAS